jgi:peptidoglycan/xylan/chitin deacetylase (PgdA/CDA1 family)
MPSRLGLYFHSLEPVDREPFAAVIEFARSEGYTFFGSPGDYLAADGPAAFISFDDNYRSWYESLGFLRELRLPVTFYVNTAPLRSIATAAVTDAYFDRIGYRGHRQALSPSELVALVDAGHTIGAHTHTHRDLAKLTRQEAMREVTTNRDSLEDLVGFRVRHFAFPYGLRRHFPRWALTWLHDEGFETVAAAIPAMLHSPVETGWIHRHPWRFERSFSENLDDIKVDGRVFEMVTGRSAVG